MTDIVEVAVPPELDFRVIPVARLQRGDMIVIRSERRWSDDQYRIVSEHVGKMISQHCGFHVPILLVENGDEFQIVRPEEAP